MEPRANLSSSSSLKAHRSRDAVTSAAHFQAPGPEREVAERLSRDRAHPRYRGKKCRSRCENGLVPDASDDPALNCEPSRSLAPARPAQTGASW